MLIARMYCGADALWRLSGCLCFASDVCSSLDRRTIVMRILRGIRMMMIRLIIRATCHCEVRATCFPEGGVPTQPICFFSPFLLFEFYFDLALFSFLIRYLQSCFDPRLIFIWLHSPSSRLIHNNMKHGLEDFFFIFIYLFIYFYPLCSVLAIFPYPWYPVYGACHSSHLYPRK